MFCLLFLACFLASCSAVIAQPLDPRVRNLADGGLASSSLIDSELSSTVYVDEIGSEQKGQLGRVEQFVADRQWTEASDMLARLSESDQTRLVALQDPRSANNGYRRYIPLNQAIDSWMARLAYLSRDTLAHYRRRMDPLARQWWQQVDTRQDPELLKQITTEAFHTSYGDEALLRLGDRALEEGKFALARRHYRAMHGVQWWHRSVRLPFWLRLEQGEESSTVAQEIIGEEPRREYGPRIYVDCDIPIADVWARLILTSILQGDRQRARAELAILEQTWPAAVGTIGGKHGAYRDLLASMLANVEPGALAVSDDWHTFGGSWTRTRSLQVDIQLPMHCAWRFPLSPVDSSELAEQRSLRLQLGLPRQAAGETADRPCRHFPIVFDDLVVLQDQERFHCLELATGKSVWSQDPSIPFFDGTTSADVSIRGAGPSTQVLLGHARHTVSYASQRVTATLHPRAGRSSLVGFGIGQQGAIELGPITGDNAKWTFHGSPIHDQDRCWVGMRYRDTTAQDYVVCYDVQTGELQWQTRVCSAEWMGGDLVELACNFLLTKHEDTIYASSHLGTIAAIDRASGAIRWLTTYPRQGPRSENLTDQSWYATRDLTPCMVHDDILIAAPSDTDQILALQADTGELLWSTELAADVTQILGVTDDRQLVLSGRRVWWLDLYTGQPTRTIGSNPFPPNAASEPTGVGRGLLSRGKIYWPAVEGDTSKLYVLGQSDGKLTQQPWDLDLRNVQAGNLVAVPGYLLIAGPEELAVFQMRP